MVVFATGVVRWKLKSRTQGIKSLRTEPGALSNLRELERFGVDRDHDCCVRYRGVSGALLLVAFAVYKQQD